jgi:hypothetical protein
MATDAAKLQEATDTLTAEINSLRVVLLFLAMDRIEEKPDPVPRVDHIARDLADFFDNPKRGPTFSGDPSPERTDANRERTRGAVERFLADLRRAAVKAEQRRGGGVPVESDAG